MRGLWGGWLSVALASAALAFSPAITEEQGLRLEVPEQAPWTAFDAPRPVEVLVTNRGEQPVSGTVIARVVDTWSFAGPAEQPFQAAAGATAKVTFNVVMGRGTYRSLYPFYATARLTRGGQPVEARTVLVIAGEPPAALAGGRLPERELTVLRAATAPTIDGQLGDWADSAWLTFDETAASIGQPRPEDFSVRVAARWDDSHFYLAVEATDDDLSVTDTATPDLMNSDYVRLVLSRRGPGRQDAELTADDLLLVLTPTGPAGRPLARAVTYNGRGRADVAVDAVRLAGVRTPTGWQLEAAVPRATLGFDPRAGLAVGGNLFFGDADHGTREAELTLGGTVGSYWLNPQMFTAVRFSDRTAVAGATLPVTRLPGRGAVPLARLKPGRVTLRPEGGAALPQPNWTGVDQTTGTQWQVGATVTRGEPRTSISLHPPWRGGRGEVAADYALQLPDARPIVFRSGLAIRDSNEGEPLSDGVTFTVSVSTDEKTFVKLLEKHTDAKVWEDVEVDLSAYAGRLITLRLEAGPGPRGNTVCDNGFWGGPLVRVGTEPRTLTAEAKTALANRAIAAATRQDGGLTPLVWRLETPATGAVNAAIALGPNGLLDAQIAFVAGGRALVIDGTEAAVGGLPLQTILTADEPEVGLSRGLPTRATVTVKAVVGEQVIPVEARLEPVAGGLQIAWSMPGVQRDRRGEPRFTQLALGPASEPARRVYYGHGQVVVGAPQFTVGYGGFALSTRYAGMDYPNGLSLVQSTDPVPDRLSHNMATRRTTLEAHHDTTFTLVPSVNGAFAAARAWRRIANLPAAPGVPAIRGKMCLDQWGGDYAQAARGLRLATAYGLDEAVFVKHVWQRWGYDYRLPDIYPPAGNRADFDDMVAAAKLNGRQFCLHDNYIDIYPDFSEFTYDLVAFGADGQPAKAWYNKGRDAQSYKWLPGAFQPWLERNVRLIKESIAPTSYFIDVWSAAPPADRYDRQGNFLPKMADTAASAKGFDTVREILGGTTISEAGHDGLIGHLDAAQADHPAVSREPGDFRNFIRGYEQADRTPWFDMGHHGKFVLFAGGLGNRYQGDGPTDLHGYGSDDYLSLTVLGGRTPMCDGPFSRRAVMTYWLLQPLCAELERQEMLAHAFDGENVRRQSVTWSNGKVTVNRGETDWRVGEVILPEYGFVAEAGAQRADISRRDGLITAFASRPGELFADARPPDRYTGNTRNVTVTVGAFRDLGQRRFQFPLTFQVDEPLPETARLFIHLCGPAELLPGWEPNSDILFQAGHNLAPDALAKPGRYEVLVTGTLPEALRPGQVAIKYGVYDPARGGARYLLKARPTDGDRFDGGLITITGTGADTRLVWAESPPSPLGARQNLERRPIDFGPVVTNTAFRLRHAGDVWTLVLLPGCEAARVGLKLDRLGAGGRRVVRLEEIDSDGQVRGAVTPEIAGNLVSFNTGAGVFGYRLTLAP